MSGPEKKKQKKEKVQKSIQQAMKKASDQQDSKPSLKKLYTNKRVLLKAKELYRGKIPEGEEKYLFQYHVQGVNDDCKSFVLKFVRIYVVEDSILLKSYPACCY